MSVTMAVATVVRGVFFDIDGTLLDSNGAHARAWSEALRESGFDLPVERLLPLIGMGGDKLLEITSGLAADSERGKRISERSGAIFDERYLHDLRPFPRARELLQELRARGVLVGIATSAGAQHCAKLLDQAAVRNLIELSVTSDDVRNSKPDPDIVAKAVERAELPKGALVLVGDTPYDVEAAERAGIACIAVRSGGWNDDRLAGAVAIHDDVAAVREHLLAAPGPWCLPQRRKRA